jgi:hypothetical protein
MCEHLSWLKPINGKKICPESQDLKSDTKGLHCVTYSPTKQVEMLMWKMETTLLDYELTTNITYMVYGKITLKWNLKSVRVWTEFMKIRLGISQVESLECGNGFFLFFVFWFPKSTWNFSSSRVIIYLLKMDFALRAYLII